MCPDCAEDVERFRAMLWRIWVPDDWRRVLITSSGHVTTAPIVPPILKATRKKESQQPLSNNSKGRRRRPNGAAPGLFGTLWCPVNTELLNVFNALLGRDPKKAGSPSQVHCQETVRLQETPQMILYKATPLRPVHLLPEQA